MSLTAFAGWLMMTAVGAAMPSADAELEHVREAAHLAATKIEAVRVAGLTSNEQTAKYLEDKRQKALVAAARIEKYVPIARKRTSLELRFMLLNEAKRLDDLVEDLVEGLGTVKGVPPDLQNQVTTWFRDMSAASIGLLDTVVKLEGVLQKQLQVADSRLAACGKSE
jgi:hypothetical protein